MKLEELEVYNKSMALADKVWTIVLGWDFFAKDTVGKQLVRAIDSISANLREGFGRYHYKDKMRFSYYSRGYLFESKTWITKARNRNLMGDEDAEEFLSFLNDLGVKLNNYISATAKQAAKDN